MGPVVIHLYRQVHGCFIRTSTTEAKGVIQTTKMSDSLSYHSLSPVFNISMWAMGIDLQQHVQWDLSIMVVMDLFAFICSFIQATLFRISTTGTKSW